VSRLTWTTLAVLGWPFVGLVGFAVAEVLPEDHIWAQATAALLWSLPPWLGLIWPVWTAVVARLLKSERPWMLVSLVGLVATGVPVQCVPAASTPTVEDAVSVAVFNVNAYSPHPSPEPLFATVDAFALDLLVILERRFDDIPGYTRVADDFPGQWPRPSHHSAVYAREGLRVDARITEQVGSDIQAMPIAIAWLPTVQACVLAIHAPPQVPKNATGMGPYVAWLTERVADGRVVHDLAPCPTGSAVVMAGDFNHVPASHPMRRLRATGLDDVLMGTGLASLTWPSGGGWLDFPVFRLDHVLAGPVQITHLEKTRIPGSDHQGWVFRVGAQPAR